MEIREKRNKKGQVAVILILLVAAGLIFYAITMNLGRLSQIKALTTIASNTTTSQLGSQMASYGQQISQERLGGRFQKCKYSGVLRALIMGIILGGLAIFTAGLGSMLATALGLPAWVGAVLTGGIMAIPLVLQTTVIEPSLTNKWNKLMSGLPTIEDNFTEQGIMTGLQGVVTDHVLVADVDDADQDQLWGYDGNEPRDRISRFNIYYNERLKSIKPKDNQDVQAFIDALKEFLYEDPPSGLDDGWAIIDPWVGCPTSECDPCCVPLMDPADPTAQLRPEECPDDATVVPQCKANSPYGANYPFVYDPFYELPGNSFLSFREQLGRDDEHQLFTKDPTDPNYVQQTPTFPVPPLLPPNNFLIQDATGYYATDDRPGIFSYFYKLGDWKLDLAGWDWNPVTFDPTTNNPPEQCHWVAQAYGAPYNLCVPVMPTLSPELRPTLTLPIDPVTLTYNTHPYVDSIADSLAAIPVHIPLAPDKIGYLDPGAPLGTVEPLRAIVADTTPPGFCADDILTNPDYQGFWKKGGDRFCSPGEGGAGCTTSDCWPYSMECAKQVGCDPVANPEGCVCREVPPAENWPDDSLDSLVYGLQNFILDAQEIFAIGTIDQIAEDFENWYPNMAKWIEPGTDPPPSGSSAVAGTDCFGDATNPCINTEDGGLIKMYKMIRTMKQRLESLRDTSYASAPGVCDEVWCVPGAGCPFGGNQSLPTDPSSEASTFNVNGNAGTGDMEDVVACLDWNVNHTVAYPNAATSSDPATTTATGNADKFKACIDECNAGGLGVAEKCADLPRSLVRAVDTRLPNQNDLARLHGCLNSCNNANCQAMSPAYFTGDPATTDFAATECPTWGPGNVWYDEIIAALGGVCNPLPGGWLDGIIRSFPEAQNQVPKFLQRQTFLQNRLNEINNVITILGNAEIKFNEFLTCADVSPADGEPDGPACKLIKDRINYVYKASGLPYQVIYGWQDEATTANPIGRWHLVKVDVRIPRKCDNACGVTGAPPTETFGTPDPAMWPWVQTKNKGFMNMKRCYFMTNTTGMVKTRITRFDENRGSSILFPNGVPLWEFRYFHPNRPIDYNDPLNPYDPQDLLGACAGSVVPDPPPLLGPETNLYRGAFILNERLTPSLDPGCVSACAGNSACEAACFGNTACWDLAQAILTRGVTTETCGKYYWHGGMREGMGFKFVPCPDF